MSNVAAGKSGCKWEPMVDSARLHQTPPLPKRTEIPKAPMLPLQKLKSHTGPKSGRKIPMGNEDVDRMLSARSRSISDRMQSMANQLLDYARQNETMTHRMRYYHDDISSPSLTSPVTPRIHAQKRRRRKSTGEFGSGSDTCRSGVKSVGFPDASTYGWRGRNLAGIQEAKEEIAKDSLNEELRAEVERLKTLVESERRSKNEELLQRRTEFDATEKMLTVILGFVRESTASVERLSPARQSTLCPLDTPCAKDGIEEHASLISPSAHGDHVRKRSSVCPPLFGVPILNTNVGTANCERVPTKLESPTAESGFLLAGSPEFLSADPIASAPSCGSPLTDCESASMVSVSSPSNASPSTPRALSSSGRSCATSRYEGGSETGAESDVLSCTIEATGRPPVGDYSTRDSYRAASPIEIVRREAPYRTVRHVLRSQWNLPCTQDPTSPLSSAKSPMGAFHRLRLTHSSLSSKSLSPYRQAHSPPTGLKSPLRKESRSPRSLLHSPISPVSLAGASSPILGAFVVGRQPLNTVITSCAQRASASTSPLGRIDKRTTGSPARTAAAASKQAACASAPLAAKKGARETDSLGESRVVAGAPTARQSKCPTLPPGASAQVVQPLGHDDRLRLNGAHPTPAFLDTVGSRLATLSSSPRLATLSSSPRLVTLSSNPRLATLSSPRLATLSSPRLTTLSSSPRFFVQETRFPTTNTAYMNVVSAEHLPHAPIYSASCVALPGSPHCQTRAHDWISPRAKIESSCRTPFRSYVSQQSVDPRQMR